jgi:hypothetical protein
MKMTATVMICDGRYDSSGESTFIADVSFPETVPIRSGFFEDGQPLGTAKLRKDGDAVVADLDIMEDVDMSLIPCIAGRVGIRNPTSCGFNLGQLELTMIALMRGPNCDERIRSLGEQLRMENGE